MRGWPRNRRLRFGDAVLEHADPVDLHPDGVAGPEPDLRVHPQADDGRRPGGDDVARLQRELPGQEGDDRGDVEDEGAVVAILAKLAVYPGPNAQIARIGLLIDQDEGWPERRGRVDVLVTITQSSCAGLTMMGRDAPNLGSQ